ncbi:MAG: ATP-binding protein [Nitrososphaerales archaeon]|jgi:hypothetical protein
MIEEGQIPPDEVFSLIESETLLWLRVAAARINDEWHETHLEITSGVSPPRWSPRAWDYDEAVFRSFEADGPTVAAWLRSGEITVDDVVIKLPIVSSGQTTQWYRRSSLQAYGGLETLPWSMTSYQLAFQPLAAGRGSGAIIGNGPSFVRFAEAVASFFCFTLGPGSSVDSMSPVFQRQDLSGRIAKVRLESADIEISLEGDHLEGAVVELASFSPGPSEVLSQDHQQTMRFPLSNGLATGSWVVLKRGSQWIDRKFINYPNTLKPDPGVEVAVEPMTELMALVTGGEGAMVEFKSIIPESGSELRDKVCRAVAAFANGDGGQLLFGVADDGNMVGLGSIDAQKACDTVARFVSSIVIPIPGFRVDSVLADSEDDDSRLVLVLTVDQGGQPPYGVNPAHPRYYIRRGATTFEASADQVRALARSRPPTENQGGSLFGPQFWK